MRFTDEFRDPEIVKAIASRLKSKNDAQTVIMEVCGTHTMSIARFGLKSLMPQEVRLVSGPGCPVCVTDQLDIDSFLEIGKCPGVILATFGDMLRVPGSYSSLERMRASGIDVRIVYSPMDSLDIAQDNPNREVVFFAVGFETTIPATALTLKTASEMGLNNFYVFCAHKTIPEALRALLSDSGVNLHGLLLPGHVSTITGAMAFEFIPRDFGIACAVAGFEPVDILLGIESILHQLSSGHPTLANIYSRAVETSGNPRAAELIGEVFQPCSAKWRGLGEIPKSGLELSPEYEAMDARKRFAQTIKDVRPMLSSECMCGSVLRGIIEPADCPLFAVRCTPDEPEGPCMVSSEGACSAAFKYGG
jgi:hydrogenase expression/formation protein HypD